MQNSWPPEVEQAIKDNMSVLQADKSVLAVVHLKLTSERWSHACRDNYHWLHERRLKL